jgi:hypothetical protein
MAWLWRGFPRGTLDRQLRRGFKTTIFQKRGFRRELMSGPERGLLEGQRRQERTTIKSDHMKTNIIHQCRVFAACLAVAFAVAASAQIAPIDSKYKGQTYSEWSADFWSWAFSMPIDRNPLFDTADCSAGQRGPVWFLGGTFTSTIDPSGTVHGVANRDCVVPAGKSLFVAILNSEATTLEGYGTTDAELRAAALYFQDHAHDFVVTIDGVAVPNVASYRVQTPLFNVGPLPANNIIEWFGAAAPEGSTSAAVGDGVYLMIEPLGKGSHTLHFTAAASFTQAADGFDFEFRLDVTYHITVK